MADTAREMTGRRPAAAVIAVVTIAAAMGLATAPAIGADSRAEVVETAALADAQIPAPIKAAVAADDRPAADKALDAGRQPAQVMAFFGIAPGMKVADLVAGGGYTTELLSRIVGPGGKVYSQNGPFPEKFKRFEDAWKQRLARPAMANVVAVNRRFDAGVLPVEAGSLDAVLMNLNYHDLVGRGAPRDQLNAAVFKALKPGGIYGIVDHSAQVGSGARDVSTLHRIDESLVIKEIEKAGFKLAATGTALRHPEDDRTWYVFEHRGETDRFMLKFVKPAQGAGA